MVGKKLTGRYEIIRELGRGGMGVVYAANDPLLGREVAVKLITPALLSPEAEERFKREAHVVAQMDHPYVVPVYDIGEQDGSLFLVMPLVPGTSLRALIKDGSLSLGDSIDVAVQVAEALEYSHSKGVVHRDIKPENILVSRQDPEGIRVRITDFGLARVSSSHRLTRTGAVVGTIAYLSPEQVSGDEIDGRSDTYSLGTVLYECLVGETPFSGELQSILYRIAHENPLPPRSVGADIREELEEIVMQCLEKDPGRRPGRPREVADALIRHRSRLLESDRIQKPSMHRATIQVQRPAQSPFVGREKEFAELQRRLNAALAGECQFAVVAGERGIGKRRLLDELEALARARRIPVLHGRFLEQDQAFPYQGFCDAIQEFFRLRPASSSSLDFSDLAPELISLFPMLKEIETIKSALSDDARPAALEMVRKPDDRTHIFEVIASAVIRIADGKPLVLFFEDLHAGDISLEALQYMVRRLGPTPTLIVGSYRTTDVGKQHPIIRMLDSFQGDRRFVFLRLESFLPTEHRSLVESLIGSANLEHDLAKRLYEATEGNPYFTRELVRSLMDTGRIIKTETGSWNLSGETAISSEALPATIQQIVQKRIERLPRNLRELLGIASVLGKTFEFRDLVGLAAKKQKLESLLESLVEAGFIVEERESRGDRFAFSSGVVRDVLYSALSRAKRKTLHRKYAEWLEKRFSGRLERIYPQLVHHYLAADVSEKVVEFGLKLARKSLDAFSVDEAMRAVRTVLDSQEEEISDNQSVQAEARTILAQAHRMAGNIDPALAEWELVANLFTKEKQPAQAFDAILNAAETAWEGRRVEETRRWVERGLEAARETGQTGSLVRILSLGATIANFRGEYERAKEYLEEIERLQPTVKEREQEAPAGGTLIVALPSAIQAMHPAHIELDQDGEIFANVFETLVTTDAHGNVIPFLCERWEVLDQGQRFVFVLRQNVKTHDGQSLSAKELKSSFENTIRLCLDALPPALSIIEGVADFCEGRAEHVTGIVVLSDSTLQIRIREPLPIYPALLTDVWTGIVKEAPAVSGSQPALIGTGLFKLKSLSPDRAVLERNPDHWKGCPPALDAVEFHAGLTATEIAAGFRSGELDLVRDLLPEDLEQILRDRRLRAGLVEAPQENTYFVLFNGSSPLARIPELRRSLCGIVRTHDLVRGALGRFAQPAEGLFPPGILGHDPGRRRYAISRDKVMELLGSSQLSFPLRLKAAVHPIFQDRYASLINALFRIWEDLGVQVSIETPEMSSFLETLQKNEGIDLTISRWIADYDDPDNFTYFLFHSRTGKYRSYYSSSEMDGLMEEARVQNSPAAREKIYRKIESFLMETAFFLPLFHEIDCRVANPRVRGLTLSSIPPYVNYAQLGKAGESAAVVTRKNTGGVIHIPIIDEIRSLDPSLVSTQVQVSVVPAVFEALTRQSEGARIIPWLVSDFQAEQGGRRFRFRLRQDVRFHDGRRLTARDVRYSFEHLLQNRESASRGLLSPIRGARELLSGAGGELTGFTILSASEFTIDLDQPVSFFPALLTYTAAAIIPEGAQQFDGNWREGCIGTGPFRVARFEPGRLLELEANPYYWRRGYPKSDGMVFLFAVPPAEILSGFRDGHFSLAWDLFPSDVDALRHDSGFAANYRETPRLSTYFVAFNTIAGPLSEPALRRQLIQGSDVERLVQRNLGRLAIPAYGVIPPGLLGYEPSRRFSRPAPETRVGEDIQLTGIMGSIYYGACSAVAGDLLNGFRERGFAVNVIETTIESFGKMLASAQIDVALTRWISDYPDADTFVHGLLHSKEGLIGRFCGTPEVDNLIQRGRSETDPEIRHDIYREVEDIVSRNALLLPLFHEQAYRFARPEVEGLEVTLSIETVPYEKLWIRR